MACWAQPAHAARRPTVTRTHSSLWKAENGRDGEKRSRPMSTGHQSVSCLVPPDSAKPPSKEGGVVRSRATSRETQPEMHRETRTRECSTTENWPSRSTETSLATGRCPTRPSLKITDEPVKKSHISELEHHQERHDQTCLGFVGRGCASGSPTRSRHARRVEAAQGCKGCSPFPLRA